MTDGTNDDAFRDEREGENEAMRDDGSRGDENTRAERKERNEQGSGNAGRFPEADRGIPSVGNAPRSKIAERATITALGIVVIAALIAVNGGFAYVKGDGEDGDSPSFAHKTVANRLGAPPEAPKKVAPLSENEAAAKPTTPTVIRTGELPPPRYGRDDAHNRPPTPEERKRASGLLAYGATTGGAARPDGKTERSDAIDSDLKTPKLKGTRAALLPDRDMFLTRGAFLDCALETAISSDVAGMTSCRLTRDVYGTSGRVKLLERGSRVVGEYKSGLERGKARLFVLWNRVETPSGVIVELDSPGTDALGRAGHEGYVDSHFWERFGGAVMLSLLDDLGNYASASAAGGNGSGFYPGGAADSATNAAGIALENSVGIRPTLVKNQGEHINIFVAGDVDFRDVYALESDES